MPGGGVDPGVYQPRVGMVGSSEWGATIEIQALAVAPGNSQVYRRDWRSAFGTAAWSRAKRSVGPDRAAGRAICRAFTPPPCANALGLLPKLSLV